MDTKKYVDHFRRTIIDYAIPYEDIVIAPHSNEITMFNGISVVDYMKCDDRLVKPMSKQVAKDLHVKYKRGIEL